MPFDDDMKHESMTSTFAWTGSAVAVAVAVAAFVATQ